jgi:hypothetical protein
MMRLRIVNTGGKSVMRLTSVLVAAMAVGMLASCQTKETKPATVERTSEVTATVAAIDVPKRLVTLKGQDGKMLTVEAGEEVRNLPQVEVGDRVVVRYHEAIAAQIAEPGQKASASAMATRAPLGARPGAGLAQQVTATVKITALDLARHSVSFTDPDGLAQTITVQEPKMRDFLKTLKVGDEVAVTYTEALAISVEPASS